MKQVVYLASDHAGFEMKNAIAEMLRADGYDVVDKGALTLDPQDDYPAFMKAAAEAVAEKEGSFGVLFGGSGEGEAMVANRIKGVRAAEYYGGSDDIIRLSREHNDANVLSLGARFLSIEQAKRAVTLWLGTAFSGDERHKRRIAEIDDKKL